MVADVLSKVITFGVFGAVGWAIARRWRLPVPSRTWLLLIVAVFAGAFVGVNTNVVCLNAVGICMPLNWAIASCCLGLLVGLWRRVRASRQSARPGNREP